MNQQERGECFRVAVLRCNKSSRSREHVKTSQLPTQYRTFFEITTNKKIKIQSNEQYEEGEKENNKEDEDEGDEASRAQTKSGLGLGNGYANEWHDYT